MQAVVVGASPVRRRVVAVLGKERDAAGVVVGAAERVLNLTGKILAGLAAKRQFQRIAFQISLGLHLADLAKRKVRSHVITTDQNGRIGIDRAEHVDASSADINGAERAFCGDLVLSADAVLKSVRNAGARIERDHADRDLRQHRGIDGIRDQRRIDDEPPEIDAVEVEQVADRAGAGAVVEQAGASANYRFTFFTGRIGEAEARREVVRLIVKVVLPVIPHAHVHRQIRSHTNIVFDKCAQDFFQKSHMPLARLYEIGCRHTGRVVGGTGEG